MCSNKGEKRFARKIMDEYRVALDHSIKKESGKHENIDTMEVWFGSENFKPTQVSCSEKDQYRIDIFQHYAEINSSQNVLRNVEKYIQYSPDKRLGISRTEHLRYHIEHYLHEIFILRERLSAFCPLIAKAHKGRSSECQVKNAMDDIRSEIMESFDVIVEIRNEHVHRNKRFEDKGLKGLASLEFFSVNSDSQQYYHNLYNRKYRLEKKRWMENIKKSNLGFDKLFDSYFNEMHKIVFQHGRLFFPKS